MVKKKIITPAKIVEMAVATEEKEIMEPLEHSTTTTPEVPEGKVLVNDDALQNMLKRMDLLESQNEGFKKELEAVADKTKLDRYRDSIAPKNGTTMLLSVIDGKVVTGWTKMPINICERGAGGAFREEQQRTLLLEDGTQITGHLSDFNKHITKIDAVVTARKTMMTDIGEQEIISLAAENGKDYEIDKRFVN